MPDKNNWLVGIPPCDDESCNILFAVWIITFALDVPFRKTFLNVNDDKRALAQNYLDSVKVMLTELMQ